DAAAGSGGRAARSPTWTAFVSDRIARLRNGIAAQRDARLALAGRRSRCWAADDRAVLGADGHPRDQGKGAQDQARAPDDLAAGASCGRAAAALARAAVGKAPDSAPVFATADGGHLSPNAITKAWPPAMAAIGMPAATLHSLRHTHASMLINAGLDILTISRRLGHSSPTITLNVYGHLIHGGDDRAAQIMDAAFGSKMVASN